MSGRHHAVLFAPDRNRRHGGAMQPPAQRTIVEIGRLEADEGAEAQHLIAAHFLLDVAAAVGKKAPCHRAIRVGKIELAQRGVIDAALRL